MKRKGWLWKGKDDYEKERMIMRRKGWLWKGKDDYEKESINMDSNTPIGWIIWMYLVNKW